MGKQITLNCETLKVLTSLAPEPIHKVIITCKGTEPKAFYPLCNSVNGYEAKQLILVSEILREKEISPQMLADFNKAYMDGYERAYMECQESIKRSIDDMFNGLRG